MISIAICDDDRAFLKEFTRLIHDYFKEYKKSVYIKTFSNGKELLRSKDEFKYVFLDIDMPEIVGTEVARILCKHKDIDIDIIFVTNHDGMVYESLKYQPLRFLRKSKIDVELAEVLRTIIMTDSKKTNIISFNTRNGIIYQKVNDIMYIDVLDHDVIVHTKDIEVHVYGTLNYFEEKLKDDSFVRIHKSFLVNSRFINTINSKNVILDNQKQLPLSRYKADKVKNVFQDYLRRN